VYAVNVDFNEAQVIFSGPLDKNSRAWKAIEEIELGTYSFPQV
jgi:hypothetical protein